MLFNKWLQFGLSTVMALTGVAAGFDWSGVVSAGTAGKITAGLAAIKMITNAIAPSGAAVTGSSAVVTKK